MSIVTSKSIGSVQGKDFYLAPEFAKLSKLSKNNLFAAIINEDKSVSILLLNSSLLVLELKERNITEFEWCADDNKLSNLSSFVFMTDKGILYAYTISFKRSKGKSQTSSGKSLQCESINQISLKIFSLNKDDVVGFILSYAKGIVTLVMGASILLIRFVSNHSPVIVSRVEMALTVTNRSLIVQRGNFLLLYSASQMLFGIVSCFNGQLLAHIGLKHCFTTDPSSTYTNYHDISKAIFNMEVSYNLQYIAISLRSRSSDSIKVLNLEQFFRVNPDKINSENVKKHKDALLEKDLSGDDCVPKFLAQTESESNEQLLNFASRFFIALEDESELYFVKSLAAPNQHFNCIKSSFYMGEMIIVHWGQNLNGCYDSRVGYGIIVSYFASSSEPIHNYELVESTILLVPFAYEASQSTSSKVILTIATATEALDLFLPDSRPGSLTISIRRDSETSSINSCDSSRKRNFLNQDMEAIGRLKAYIERDPTLQDRFQKWKKLKLEELVFESLIHGILPIAKTFVIATGRFTNLTSEQIDANFNEIGMQFAYESLSQGDIDLFLKIFENLGLDSWQKLKNILIETRFPSVRRLSFEKLFLSNKLTTSQVESYELVLLLDELYPCICKSSVESNTKETHELCALPERIREILSLDLTLEVLEVFNVDFGTMSHFSISILLKIDQATRDSLVIAGCLKTNIDFPLFITPIQVWEHLLEVQEVDKLLSWVEHSRHSDASNKESAVRKSFSWPLTAEMIEKLGQCNIASVRDSVLDCLANYGIFCSAELNNNSLLINRLGRINKSLFANNAQPISVSISSNLADATLSQEDIYNRFVDYCFQNDLSELLFDYSEFHKLAIDTLQSRACDMVSQVPPWFELLVAFKKWRTNLSSPDLFAECHHKGCDYAGYEGRKYVDQMISDGYVALGLFNALAPGKKITELVADFSLSENNLLLTDDFVTFLNCHPALKQMMLVDFRSKPSELSLSDLLKGNCIFDQSKLYNCDSESSFGDLLMFSNENLCRLYGMNLELDYVYYLGQCRPSFALAKFVSTVLLKAGYLPDTSVNEAFLTGCSIAMDNFTGAVAGPASCVSFVEMLGRDSTPLRTMFTVARLVLSHWTECNQSSEQGAIRKGTDAQIDAITYDAIAVDKLQNLLADHAGNCVELYYHVEPAYLWFLDSNQISRCSVCALKMAQMIEEFCRINDLERSNVYLISCAKKNDWLMYLTYLNLFDIPLDKALGVLPKFSDLIILNHLTTVLKKRRVYFLSGSERKQSKVNITPRDVRSRLYSRIGVRIQRRASVSDLMSSTTGPESSMPSGSPSVSHSYSTSDSGTEHSSEQTECDVSQSLDEFVGNNLFATVLQCQKSLCPAKMMLLYAMKCSNPIFAVLARCYENSQVISCIVVYVLSALDENSVVCIMKQLTKQLVNLYQQVADRDWSLTDCQLVLKELIVRRHFALFEECLFIFQRRTMETPLYWFAKYLMNVFVHHNNDNEMLSNYANSLQSGLTFEDGLFNDRSFIRETAGMLLLESMKLCKNNHTKYHLLNNLCRFETNNIFTLNGFSPAFEFLRKLHLAVSPHSLSLNFVAFANGLRSRRVSGSVNMNAYASAFAVECESVIDHLLAEQLFHPAHEFSKCARYDLSEGIILQLRNDLEKVMKTVLWANQKTRHNFFQKCISFIVDNRVEYHLAAKFFQSCADNAADVCERCSLLVVVWKFMRKSKAVSTETVAVAEVEMWKCKILLEVIGSSSDQMDLSLTDTASSLDENILTTEEIVSKAAIPEEFLIGANLTNLNQKAALESLIGQELDKNNVSLAYRLTKIFGVSCQDLDNIMACIGLSDGSLSQFKLPVHIQKLLEILPIRKTQRVQRFSRKHSLSNSYNSFTIIENPNANILDSWNARISEISDTSVANCALPDDDLNNQLIDLMEKIRDRCTLGLLCCDNVITLFRIATVLDRSYKEIAAEVTDCFTLVLKSLLQSNHPDKFVLAKDLVTSHSQNVFTEDIAQFLCGEILYTLRIYTGLNDSNELFPASKDDLIFNPMSDGFGQLIKIYHNSIPLGNKLMAEVDKMIVKSADQFSEILYAMTELCVCAHVCYSTACDVEGISKVLKVAQKIISVHLVPRHEYNIMIRLLTGLGRYNEMTYVFDILWDHHQFELLLRKGMEKVDELKMAILNYLRRFHADNIEMCTMVALHFSLYREIAVMLKNEGTRLLGTFNDKTIEPTDSNREILENIMQYFADASESFVKSDCLNQAIYCCKQAELTALQIYLLTYSKCRVINLTDDPFALREFLVNHRSFPQAYIVAEAYNKHEIWPWAVFKNCFLDMDTEYLFGFTAKVEITAEFIEEITEMYKTIEIKQTWQEITMREVLTKHCNDVVLKYKMAEEFGFTDLSDNLLTGSNGPYLRDVLSKQWLF